MDIEGLRGVAVVVVVLFHAGLERFSGGFVGVDVFFVLSGFLITGLLLDERLRSGRIAFGEFYARRVRRLLPASMLVFIATVVLARWLLSPLDLVDLGPQARWVALFGSNIWFASHATDYLQPDVVSPFQQYWSLAVEEQFYLVWPLVVLVLGLGAKSRRSLLVRVGTGLALIVVASFVGAVWLTSVRQPSAFFLLPPRAWELGAGGLLAIALRLGLAPLRRVAGPLSLLGAAAVLVPVAVYGPTTTFPGWVALFPVLGTVAILYAGVTRRSDNSSGSDNSGRLTSVIGLASASEPAPAPAPGVNRLLGSRPLRWVGRYSYSLYLWHWPLLVIPAAAAGRALTLGERSGLVAVSVVAAVASFHLIENRFRYMGLLSRRVSVSYAFGVVLLAFALLAITTFPTTETVEEMALSASVEGENGLSPEVAGKLADAPDDQAPVYEDNCHRPPELDEASEPIDADACASGAVAGSAAPTVMLLGDSHAAHYQPALSKLGEDSGWRLVSLTRSWCPLIDVPVELEQTQQHYGECDQWRQEIFDLVAQERPDAVVLGQRSSFYAEQVGQADWIAAFEDTVRRLAASTKVLVLRDLPDSERSVPKCVLANSDDVRTCEFGSTADDRALSMAERAAVQRAGGRYLDPVPMVCPNEHCPVISGDEIVFSDSNHLTASYSRSIAGSLGRLIGPAIEG